MRTLYRENWMAYNGPDRQQDLQSLSNRENSSQEIEIRDIENRNGSIRREGLSEPINILSDEINARFSWQMDSLMNLIQSQINRAISSAISDRVIPEVQKIMGSLLLNRNGPEPYTSLKEGGIGNARKNTNVKFTKRDSRSACDLREDTGFTPYRYLT